ncbi:MAG TPA: hypothetical protein VIL07_06005 [Symbiobacteriaceae bacterium]
MPVNRFWRSVGSVAAYLFAIGLLQVIVAQLLTLFGLLPLGITAPLRETAIAIVPLVATFLYLDWRWGWGPEHIGLPRGAGAAGMALLGLLLGVAAAVASHLASALLGRFPISLEAFRPAPFSAALLVDVLILIVMGFSVELMFRGVTMARYLADLSYEEAVLAGVLTPFAWAVLSTAVLGGFSTAGIYGPWQSAMSVALSLIFLRKESVWLTSGLRIGMFLPMALLNLRITEAGGFLIWGTVAAILGAMEWNRIKHLPRPMGSSRRYGDRYRRGPWGPY